MSQTAEQLTEEIRITLMTLDENRIRRFARSWGVKLPEESRLFWIHVCKVILQFPGMPKGIQMEAERRLRRLEAEDCGSVSI